jgi:hypothetical protein
MHDVGGLLVARNSIVMRDVKTGQSHAHTPDPGGFLENLEQRQAFLLVGRE